MRTTYILTIAGSDILSGGGMQADLATFCAYKLYGFVAQTCMTAIVDEGFEVIPTQNDIFKKQLHSLSRIPFSAIKIGLLPTPEIVQEVLYFIKNYQDIPIVLDPVLVFKENNDEQVNRMAQSIKTLFPYVTLITPNLEEAKLLSDRQIKNLSDIEAATIKLQEEKARNVLIKGGARLKGQRAVDILRQENSRVDILSSPIIEGHNQGAGCTFAAAIASGLAQNMSLLKACHCAKDFVCKAISHSNEYGVNINETI